MQTIYEQHDLMKKNWKKHLSIEEPELWFQMTLFLAWIQCVNLVLPWLLDVLTWIEEDAVEKLNWT